MPPHNLDDLVPAEKLLVLACRRTVPGRVAGPCVEMAWRLGCGDALGACSARAFADMTQVLAAGARRPLHLGLPHAERLSMDERALLELVAACQCGAAALAMALACWLVRAPQHAGLLGTALALARVMHAGGLRLRPPGVFRADRLDALPCGT